MADRAPVQIALEDDPTPLVRIVGAMLKRSARNGGLESKLRGMQGVVALKSSVDPQAVTIRFATTLTNSPPCCSACTKKSSDVHGP